MRLMGFLKNPAKLLIPDQGISQSKRTRLSTWECWGIERLQNPRALLSSPLTHIFNPILPSQSKAKKPDPSPIGNIKTCALRTCTVWGPVRVSSVATKSKCAVRSSSLFIKSSPFVMIVDQGPEHAGTKERCWVKHHIISTRVSSQWVYHLHLPKITHVSFSHYTNSPSPKK